MTEHVFDTASYLEALAPPVLVAGGRRYPGRLLSLPQFLRLSAAMKAQRATLKPDSGDADAQLLALQELATIVVRATIPVSFVDRARSWLGRPTAWEAFASLPFGVQQRVMADFLGLQAAAQGMTEMTPTATPPSTTAPADSPPKPESAPLLAVTS